MKIIVAGCGKIGCAIIESLTGEGHNVVALDENPDVIETLTNTHDIMGVCGGGADCEALADAGVEKAELFIAVTGSDELNMLSCYIAGKMGAAHTIARIRNPEYNDKSLDFMKQQLGLAMSLNPEMLAAHELFNMLKLPSAVNIESFSSRNFELIELIIREDSVLNGMRLMDIRGRFKSNFLVCAVQRGKDVYIPDGSFELLAGDKIGIAAPHLDIQKTLKEMGLLKKQAKNVMLLGGSRTAFYLAKMLTAVGNNVKIIERKEDVCERLTALVPKADVICGDGANQDLLLEEGMASMDAFVSLTGMDEENILISIFAGSHNVPKVITKVNGDELATLASKLGLDSIISPKKAVSDIVVRYARALRNAYGSKIETLYQLMDNSAEAIEFTVNPESRVTGIPLKNLNIKKGILVAGIIHGGKPFIPTGDDVISAGDRVIIVSSHKFLGDLSEIVR